MPLLPLLIGSSIAIGVGYFCVDVYRNRHRLSERPVPEADLTCYELGIPNHADCQTIEQTVNHAGHAISEATGECISGGVGHCVDAIAHVFSLKFERRFNVVATQIAKLTMLQER